MQQEFGVQSCLEAASMRETVLAYRPGNLQRPLDIYRAVESESLRADRNLNGYPSVRLSEAEKVMLHFKCMPEKEKVNPKAKTKELMIPRGSRRGADGGKGSGGKIEVCEWPRTLFQLQ